MMHTPKSPMPAPAFASFLGSLPDIIFREITYASSMLTDVNSQQALHPFAHFMSCP
jgi:hypothetical protein